MLLLFDSIEPKDFIELFISDELIPEHCWSDQLVCRSVYSGSPFDLKKKKKKNTSCICRPSSSLDSLWLECPDACGSGLLRAGPSGKERCTPHNSVPVSPQCPQKIGLPTLSPAVLQCAAVSSECFSVSSAQKRSATPWGVSRAARAAVPCQSSALGNRASSSKHTRGQSQETGTLVDYLAAWELLPTVSR